MFKKSLILLAAVMVSSVVFISSSAVAIEGQNAANVQQVQKQNQEQNQEQEQEQNLISTNTACANKCEHGICERKVCEGGICENMACEAAVCSCADNQKRCPSGCFYVDQNQEQEQNSTSSACVNNCGDGTCNGAENCSICMSDCGVCHSGGPFCGDGSCNGTESCSDCSQDCGSCGGGGGTGDGGGTGGGGSYCGDGVVNTGEQCDGTAGVSEGFTCTASCVLESNVCTMDLDAMIIMDISGSMGYDNPTRLSRAKIAANSFIDNLRSTDQSGLVSFNQTASLDKKLSNDHASTKTIINGLVAGGATNIGDAIDTANKELISTNNVLSTAKIEILLTDGKANKPNGDGSAENAADLALALTKSLAAAENGIRIFTIGLGNDVNDEMIKNIADNTGGKYYLAPTSAELNGIFSQIAAETCKTGSTAYIAPSLTIFNEVIAAVSDTSATVSWYTNIPATSRVVYDMVSHSSLGVSPNYDYTNSSVENSTKVISHATTLTGLTPDTTYSWRPVSSANSEVAGKELTFKTLGASANTESNPSAEGEEGTGGGEENPVIQPTTTEGGGEQAGTGINAYLAAIGNFFNAGNWCWLINLMLLIAIVVNFLSKTRRNSRFYKDKRLLVLLVLVAIATILILIYWPPCWIWVPLLIALIVLILVPVKRPQIA